MVLNCKDYSLTKPVLEMDISPLKRHVPFILIIGAFIVYLSTVCPTVYVGDSGELTAAAFSLGIPHPSGYPLFTLIGKLFCLIPIGNIAFRMNLMSVVFSLATLWIVYSIIYKITSSVVSSIFGAFTLAFTSLFWLQTVSAEVYPLHTFFVALLIRLLFYWDENRDLCRLALFAFAVGLSFLNHLQTVMLAPAVLFFLIFTNREDILKLKALAIISVLFIISLSIYIYLPVRTQAGSAIHWGDPDTLKNFINVVSGEDHRTGYVFNKTFSDYIIRSKDALMLVIQQFGVVLLFGVWGFITLPSLRWKIFYVGIIIFDFFYTVFLNTVFIEVTPFNLPTLIVFAILGGLGVSDLLTRCKKITTAGSINLYKISNIACCAVPLIYLYANYGTGDQGRNYTGYEHASNILRTVNNEGIVIIGGDNNLFPVIYSRIVERMREDVTLYDRHDLFFRIPYMGDTDGPFIYYGRWDDLLQLLEKEIIKKKASKGIYYSMFDPIIVSIPDDYLLIPYGTLTRVVNDRIEIDQNRRAHIWDYYTTESFEDTYYRDFMNRQVTAFYYFSKGRHLIMLGGVKPGLKMLKLASKIGADDKTIQNELAVLFSDLGFFNEAREELKKLLHNNKNYAWVYNSWCYYYSKQGETAKAIDSIKKAVEIEPDNTLYYNNLGNLLLAAGKKDEAVKVFRKSLSINGNQKSVKNILKEKGVSIENGE
jgi:tetratricopeptide (TPR) repeat protein